MNLDEFNLVVQEVRAEHPTWFANDMDAVATDEEIAGAEQELRVKFPNEYCGFLKMYGGGYFAFVNIFSVTPKSDWNVVRRNAAIGIKEFLAISDDESGGYYGFPIVGGACSSQIIYFDFETQEVVHGTEFDNLFGYLLEVGLQRA